MKKLISLLAILLFVNIAFAQNATNSTNQTTGSPIPTSLTGVYNFLVSINPIILIILGVVLVLVSKLAKFVGIVLIISALIHLFFLFYH
jgi:glucan phosphoethanolaminetransferase (alkaline phosphatase superfamily)